jgi:hypothetical protein
MVKDLGFNEAVYGFDAGIVYLGYALFEIPSNLLMERIGARKTFARITILWGITSVAMLSVKTATSFYILRFLLGSFEAGLLPGAVFYLTYWFPARRRADGRVIPDFHATRDHFRRPHLWLDHGLDGRHGRTRQLAMALRVGRHLCLTKMPSG